MLRNQFFNCVLLMALGASTVSACSPEYASALTSIFNNLGLSPLQGAADNTAASGDYVTDGSQLNCNFENVATCRWKNLPNTTNPAIDTTDYTIFSVDQVAAGFPLLKPVGRQPPTGSKVLFGGNQVATPGAIWMSDPFACQPGEGNLQFEYWLFGSTTVNVVLLDPTTHEQKWASSHCDGGSLLSAADGFCRVTIPAQTEPFKIGIKSNNIVNAFVIVDNIVYNTAPLGAACDGSLIFGTTSSAFVDGTTGTPVTDGAQLVCTDPATAGCLWANDGVAPEFEVHTGTPDASKWYAATGTSVVPNGEFLMVQGKPGDGPAVLRSELIECTSGSGTVSLKAWMSQGVIMKACLKDSATNEVLACQTLDRAQSPDYSFTLTAQREVQNAVLEISADNWGTGGIAAVDDIAYDFAPCGSILIGNSNTILIPYTGAPIGQILTDAELACTVDAPDSCNWGDPDPSHQWYWVDNVDPVKLQALTGTSTVPTSGAAYYEFGQANEYVFFGSDELLCVKSGGDFTFNAWAPPNVVVEVCAVMYTEARETCKGPVNVVSPGPISFSFTAAELSTTAPVVFVITGYAPTTPAFLMIDNIAFSGSVCPDPTLVTPDEQTCQALASSFNSLTALPPGWKNCELNCAGGAPAAPWFATDQVLGHHNIRVRGPIGAVKPHIGASLFYQEVNGVDVSPGISILQSAELAFTTDHWMSFSYQRGTFGSQLYICKNAVPNLVRRDIPLFHPDCQKIAGPSIDANEWISGYVSGYLITADTQRIYFVFDAPWKYTYGEAHVVIDDILIHEGATADTPPLCVPSS